MSSRCDACGRIEDPRMTVLSRHSTSQGEVVYTRCLCGSVGVRLRPDPDARRPPHEILLAQGPPAVPLPG
ncbi:hypothetical protein EHYA_07213 [Embleya hyalina]|uniref:Uncharacterized protein n=2 Tax=Embleya hyalina TaxID=516124 RepID=A0A401YY15_9ACTN|nr:hypothetical protein EHYA_07213 [Embleya hyalina]